MANITAADSTDSGRFTDVYAYCFATPRTTREPGAYRNIFNIIGKDDPVPKIPFVDWGYARYGTDLFLKTVETDADSVAVMERTAELYREMIGSDMVLNPEISYHLRTLLDYFLTLMPDSASYSDYLQPLLVDILNKNRNTENALLVLMEALERFKGTEEHEGDLHAMLEYLKTLVDFYYAEEKHENAATEEWDAGFGPLNLVHEHFPFRYLAEMFSSDDPEEVFSGKTEYIRLVIYGDVDAEISDGSRIMKAVSGESDHDTSPFSSPHIEQSGRKLVLTLPADRSFRIHVRSNAAQTVTYTGVLFSEQSIRAKEDDLYSYLMGPGDTAVITTASNGKVIEVEDCNNMDVSAYADSLYSPTAAMRLENGGTASWTLSDFMNSTFLILLFLAVELAVTLVFLAVRKNRKLTSAAALIWNGVNLVLFAALEFASWYCFPMLPHARLIPKFLVCIVLIAFSLKGYAYGRDRSRKKSLRILLLLLILLAVAESILFRAFTPPYCWITALSYFGFLIASYLLLWCEQGEKV